MTKPAAATSIKSRPERSRAPALPPLTSLDRAHRQMVSVLADLTLLIDHLEAEGVDAQARKTATTICAFFADTARQHHADEETQVFPALIRGGDSVLIGHVLRLQQDHGWLEEDWLELAPQLQAVAQGYSWYDLDTLRHAVGVFVSLYQDHIALEESLIYPEARRQLHDEATSRQHRLDATE
jgi:hemerythrin-like domain-containing protein